MTILYEDPHRSPHGTTRYQTHVDTAAELRHLVETARADPNAWHLRYGPIRICEGEQPTVCRHGHPLNGPSLIRAAVDYLNCSCGGHLLQICRRDSCGDVVTDPRPEIDCHPVLKPGQQLPDDWLA